MSQQEFAPEPQSQQSESEGEIYQPQYPYSWSGNLDAEAAPRDEPPSSYEYNPAAIEQGYQAQDIAGQQQQAAPNPYEYPNEYQQPTQQQQPPQHQYNPYSSDGDAYEQGYNPYANSYNANNTYGQNAAGQGVPPWARPQMQPRNPFRFGWIIFVLIMISMGSGLFRYGFFFGFGNFFGIIFVPILLLMIVASLISRSMWGGGRRGRRRGGPWGGW